MKVYDGREYYGQRVHRRDSCQIYMSRAPHPGSMADLTNYYSRSVTDMASSQNNSDNATAIDIQPPKSAYNFKNVYNYGYEITLLLWSACPSS
jgi:hypothetical protein